jgi:ATP-dependent DNA ligase
MALCAQRARPWARLRHLLRRRASHIIAEAVTIEGRGMALFAAVEEHDLEGIVAKRKGDPTGAA